MYHTAFVSVHLPLTHSPKKALSSLARQTGTIKPDDQLEHKGFRDPGDISNSIEFKDYSHSCRVWHPNSIPVLLCVNFLEPNSIYCLIDYHASTPCKLPRIVHCPFNFTFTLYFLSVNNKGWVIITPNSLSTVFLSMQIWIFFEYAHIISSEPVTQIFSQIIHHEYLAIIYQQLKLNCSKLGCNYFIA